MPKKAQIPGKEIFFMKQKIKSILLLLLLAILLEATVFQFSFFRSCLWQARMLDFETNWEFDPDTGEPSKMILTANVCFEEVKSLKVDVKMPEGGMLTAEVSATDEGDSYLYSLGEETLVETLPESFTFRVYPYGKVDRLEVALMPYKNSASLSAIEVEALTANVHMPYHFEPVRALIVFLAGLFFFALRKGSTLHELTFEKASSKLSGKVSLWLGIISMIAVGGLILQMNPACHGMLAEHHRQYQQLAEALTKGSVSVGEAGGALLQVENPYDTIYLQANGISYQADYAYKGGKYYVYFGVLPELLLFLPCYILTGHHLPNYLAVFVFFAGFVCACGGLAWEAMKRWFRQQPFYLVFFGLFLLTGCYNILYLVVRPDMYNIPIMAANCFAMAGLWGWLRGLNRTKRKAGWYFAGSLCMALTAACRPQFLLYALIAVPFFWKSVFEKRELFSKKGIRDTVLLILPFVLAAAGVMYYNYLRFGSVMDFGASYSLTSNDMNHRGTNLSRIIYGLLYFFILPPHLEGQFPYISSAQVLTDYMGRMISESSYGGILVCSPFLWMVPFFWKGKDAARAKGMTGIMTTAVTASLIIGAVDANSAGILQRYSADMAFGMLIAGVFCLFLLVEYSRRKGIYSHVVTYLKAAVLLQCLFLLFFFCNTDGSVNVLNGNPELFFKIKLLLNF